jgi:ElaB/YqjD/DUF883 family membrane-anchored ribosome-binding protein
MFQPRSRDLSDPRVIAIVDHLRAIERELNEIGRATGRRASANVAATGDQIADAVGPILSDIVDRFRRGQRTAVNRAADFGNQALQIGSRLGSNAVSRLADQPKQRPLLTLAVAIGIGILIGAASRRS